VNKVRLGDCCEFVLDGTHSSPVRTPSGVPVLSAQNVVGGKLSFETARFTSLSAYDAFRRRLDVRPSDVLLTIVGTIGRVAIMTEQKPLVLQRSVAVLRPKQRVLLPSFLFRALQHDSVKAQLARSTNQSSQAGVYLGKLKEVEISLPSLDEQRRIADILDKADTLREKRRQAINKLDTLLQSVFLKMFGDPVSNPKGWKSVQLGEALELITYGLTVRPQYIDVGFPLISAREIRQGYIDFDNAPKISKEDFDRVSDKGKPKKGDILFSKTGSIGHSAIVLSDQAFAVSQNAARLKFSEEIVPEFGLHYLRLEMIQTLAKRTAKGNAVKDLQLGDMRRFPFYLPPIDLQRKFLSSQRKLEEIKAKMRRSYSNAQTMFQSLQQRAFKGELFKH